MRFSCLVATTVNIVALQGNMALDITRIRALCFDIDGTLRDTDDQYVDQLTRWLQPLRHLFAQHNPQPFARRLVMAIESPGTFFYSLPEWLRLPNHLAALVNFMYRKDLTRRPDTFWIVQGIYECLQQLSSQYPMAVISARDERTTLAFLKQFDLLPLFRCVATAHTCQRTKPYPDPILWAATQMGVKPTTCLMVGDTTIDIRAGRQAGAQTVGVLCGFGRETELYRAGANLILPSPVDLLTVLMGKTTPSQREIPHQRNA